MTRVLLINMPFAGVEYPSLALGLFKAQFALEGIECDVAYLNVRFAQMVGWENYAVVQESSAMLAGEQMFAHELFDGHVPSYERYSANVLSALDREARAKLHHLKAHVRPFLDNCFELVRWQDYDVIGFTSMFEQNLPSLSLASRVKRHHSRKIVVFGGANCEDVMGIALHRCFPFVDFVCTGEGNVAFPELVRRLSRGDSVADLPGIVYRSGDESISTGAPEKVRDLDTLPYPDYDEYFETLYRTGAPAWLSPSVAIETARGCWWGEKVMCTFCGLNGQSIAFRAKGAERALEEILHLVRRYPVRLVRAVDNMMPPSYFDELLPSLAEANPGIDLFYEVRPNMAKRQIWALSRARVTNVQAGVENLSTHILKLMKKGTTSLRNIEFLRWCKQAGVYVDWNMLFGFPGERLEDYERAFELATLITHLSPPSSVGRIRLDRFSPNFNEAREIGFGNVRPWSMFDYVYPFDRDTLDDLVYYFDHDDEGQIADGGYLERMYYHVKEWERRQDHMVATRENGSVVIHDTRAVAAKEHTVLQGAQGDVYECCDTRRKTAQIIRCLAEGGRDNVAPQELDRMLEGFVANKLMVEERGRFLSLAVFRGASCE